MSTKYFNRMYKKYFFFFIKRFKKIINYSIFM